MSNRLKKSIVLVLLVSMVFSTSFFIQPKKAEAAAASCLLSAIGSLISGIGGALSGIMSVPVADRPTENSTATGAGAGVGSNLGQCLLQVLARVAAQTIIHNFTKSTLTWINSGFHGSPSFVTNPEAFLSDVGDIAAGQFIQGLGDVGQILCSPFDLNLRISFGLSLGVGGATSPRYQYVGCRLSDVQKNIYNTFVGGQWGGNQGWQNFVSISQGANNPYGAYLYGKDAMTQQIAAKTGTQLQKLNWGSGFLSSESCTDASGNPVDVNSIDPNDEYNYMYGINCETTTPGSVIQDQLNKTLGIPAGVLSVSQDIDDILNALVNQGVTQIFSSMGLSGMSRGGSATYSGRSYLSTLTTTYQGQLSTGQILPPPGINCSKTYRVNDNGTVDVLVVNPIDGTSSWQSTTVNAGTKTPAEFQNQITRGCQNLAAAAPAQSEINSLSGPGGILSGGEPSTGCVNTAPSIKNLAGGVDIYSRVATEADWQPVDVVVDGNVGSTVSNDPYQAIRMAGSNFIEIVLPYQSDIRYLMLTPRRHNNYFSSTADGGISGAQIYFYDHIPTAAELLYVSGNSFTFSGYISGGVVTVANTQSGITSQPGTTYDGKAPFYIGNGIQTTVQANAAASPFSNLVNVKAVVIHRPSTTAIVEFQAFGYDQTNAPTSSCAGSPTGPSQSAAAITSQNVSNISIYQGNSLSNNGNLTISSSQNLPALNIKTSLVRIVGTATTSVPMNSVFSTFGESRSIIYGQTNPEILFPTPTAAIPNPPPADPGNIISLVAIEPTSPTMTYYVRFDGVLRTDAPLYTYQLVVEITENGTNLSVGMQTYTFTVLSVTSP